jgi:hypothetical protein
MAFARGALQPFRSVHARCDNEESKLGHLEILGRDRVLPERASGRVPYSVRANEILLSETRSRDSLRAIR